MSEMGWSLQVDGSEGEREDGEPGRWENGEGRKTGSQEGAWKEGREASEWRERMEGRRGSLSASCEAERTLPEESQ